MTNPDFYKSKDFKEWLARLKPLGMAKGPYFEKKVANTHIWNPQPTPPKPIKLFE